MFEMWWIHNLGIYRKISWGDMELCWQHGVYIPWGSIKSYPGDICHHESLNVPKYKKLQENTYNHLARL